MPKTANHKDINVDAMSVAMETRIQIVRNKVKT
jgi:hypothetical protein